VDIFCFAASCIEQKRYGDSRHGPCNQSDDLPRGWNPGLQGKIVSGLTDGTGLSEQDKSEVGNMVANITMYGVQGAVWNAMILLVGGMVMISVLR
jgi:hypothetical protein